MPKIWKDEITIKDGFIKDYLSDGNIQMTMTQCQQEGTVLNKTYSSRIIRGDPSCDEYHKIRAEYISKVRK